MATNKWKELEIQMDSSNFIKSIISHLWFWWVVNLGLPTNAYPKVSINSLGGAGVPVTYFDQSTLVSFIYAQVRLGVAVGDSLDDAQHIELD